MEKNNSSRSFFSIITIILLLGVIIFLVNNKNNQILFSNVNKLSASVSTIKSYKCPNGGTLTGSKCKMESPAVGGCSKGKEYNGKCLSVTGKLPKTPVYSCPDGSTPSNGKCYLKTNIETKCPDGYSRINSSTCQKLIAANISYSTRCPSGYSQVGSGTTCKKEYNASRVGSSSYKCMNGGTLIGKRCHITTTGTRTTNYSCPTGTKSGSQCILTTSLKSKCPDGYDQITGTPVCKKMISATKTVNTQDCQSGYKLSNTDTVLYSIVGKDKCVKNEGTAKTLSCPKGYSRISSSSCVYYYNATVTSIKCSNSNYNYNKSTGKCEKKSSNTTTNNQTSSSVNLKTEPSKITIVNLDQRPEILVSGLNSKESVSFSSSDEKIVSVNSKGIVTPVSVGKTTINVKRNNKTSASDECIVVVEVASMNVRATQINVTLKDSTIEAGKTTQITSSILPENATNKGVKYTSSNKNIATVDSNGTIIGKKSGNVTIYATSLDNSNIKKGKKLIVKENKKENNSNKTVPNEETITDDEIVQKYIETDVSNINMQVFNKKRIIAKYYELRQSGNKITTYIDDKNIQFNSDNNNVATVTDDGVVTAINSGETNINVTKKMIQL